MMADFEDETKPQQLTIGESVARLRQIQSGLKQVVVDLHEKLALLDCEPQLQTSLYELRRDMEARATDLEAEVKRLRADLKIVKELLGYDIEKKKTAPI
jgi:hypothetical protein